MGTTVVPNIKSFLLRLAHSSFSFYLGILVSGILCGIGLDPTPFSALNMITGLTFLGALLYSRISFSNFYGKSIFIWAIGYFSVCLRWAYAPLEGQLLPLILLIILESGLTMIGGSLWSIMLTSLPRYPSPGIFALLGALNLSFAEYLRGQVPFGGLPWGRIAFSQVNSILGEYAAVFSPLLCSFLFIFISLYAGAKILHIPRFKVFAFLQAICPLSLSLTVAASFEITTPNPNIDNSSVNILVVQGGMTYLEGEARSKELFNNQLNATKQALNKAQNLHKQIDLILWPESSSEYDPRKDADLGSRINQIVQQAQAPLLIGTQKFIPETVSPSQPTTWHRFNEYLLWTTSGPNVFYAKQHPVPFGEFVPFREIFLNLHEAVAQVGIDMWPGKKPAIIDVSLLDKRKLKIGTPICFEVADDDVVRESASLGAQFLVFPTNNVFFKHSILKDQQWAMAKWRAKETGLWVIQSSTSGITGLADPDSSSSQTLPPYEMASTVYTLPISSNPPPTFSTQTGAIQDNGLKTAVIIIAIFGAFKRIRNSANRNLSF